MNYPDTAVQLEEEGVEEEQLNSVWIATQYKYSAMPVATHRHSYSHISLGHCVHGGGDQRQLQLDVLGEIRAELDGIGGEVDVAGKNDDIAGNPGD